MFESYKNRDAKNEGHNWPGEGRRNYLHVLKIKKICPDFEKNALIVFIYGLYFLFTIFKRIRASNRKKPEIFSCKAFL